MWPIEDAAAKIYAAKMYVSVGRAIEALERFSFRGSDIPTPIWFLLLDATLKELSRVEEKAGANFAFELETVFGHLVKRQDVDRAEIAKREYAYLPLLGHRERVLVLHEILAEDPNLFVELLTDVFKTDSGKGDAEPTKEQASRARNGFRLFQSLHKIPGADEKGNVDAGALRGWVAEARELAGAVDRKAIGDRQIGRLLAYAPKDPVDGGWPHRAVRDIIEELRSDPLEEAIELEQINKRGVYMKRPFEGGGQERGMAADAATWAKTAQDWPRTSALLQRISAMWKADAEREDQRAERDRSRF